MTRALEKPRRPGYLAAAVSHPYSYLIAVLTGVAAFVAHSAWPVLAGVLVFASWVLYAARSRSFRGRIDAAHADEKKKHATSRQQEVLRTVGEEDRRRFLELDRLRAEIHKLCRQNTNITLEMVAGELDKLDHLLDSYLSIAAAVARYESYVAGSDVNQLDDEIRRQEKVVEKLDDPEAKSLARKNLELLQKRAEKSVEIRQQLKAARGQLNLIDNTVRLLRDQVVTMESPREIARELDELMSSVDAIEASSRETEALLAGPERRALTERT